MKPEDVSAPGRSGGTRWRDRLRRMGDIQARLVLGIVYFGLLTPYVLLLRLCGWKPREEGAWVDVSGQGESLSDLERSF
ncbi:MAG: hypothetical protein P1P84_07065 [Deferrisomatales bacterium]|nr:hypothetical protein [Deferrisomatales bacterium]